MIGSEQTGRVPAATQHTCHVIGILNVTPDSFSDGGRYLSLRSAIEHGIQLAASGAHYVDVGGESTRPGSVRVDLEEELRRVIPVVTELVRAGIRVSVDTSRAAVAQAACDIGVGLINDVSGGQLDSSMCDVVTRTGSSWVLMHWRGPSERMYASATYKDVVAEVKDELLRRVDAATNAGVETAQLVLDPGLGFAKQPTHDLTLLARLPELTALGMPVLVGPSRKSFLGTVLAGNGGDPRPVDQRDPATLAACVLAAEAGAWGVRVHDVRGAADALAIVAAIDASADSHDDEGSSAPPTPSRRFQ